MQWCDRNTSLRNEHRNLYSEAVHESFGFCLVTAWTGIGLSTRPGPTVRVPSALIRNKPSVVPRRRGGEQHAGRILLANLAVGDHAAEPPLVLAPSADDELPDPRRGSASIRGLGRRTVRGRGHGRARPPRQPRRGHAVLVAAVASGTEPRMVPVGQGATPAVGGKVGAQPALLGDPTPAPSDLVAGLLRAMVPGADVVAEVALGPFPHRRARVVEVPPGCRRTGTRSCPGTGWNGLQTRTRDLTRSQNDRVRAGQARAVLLVVRKFVGLSRDLPHCGEETGGRPRSGRRRDPQQSNGRVGERAAAMAGPDVQYLCRVPPRARAGRASRPRGRRRGSTGERCSAPGAGRGPHRGRGRDTRRLAFRSGRS